MHLEGTGSVGLREWSDVGLQPSRKPTDNAFVESFNGRFRDECLNTHWFLSLADARSKIDAWRRGYNECRPHTFLRSEEHTSELQSLMRISYAVFCLKKKTKTI